MRLAPAACAKALRCDPADIAGGLVGDKALHITEGLVDKLRGCADLSQAIEIFEAALKTLQIPDESLDKKIAQAIQMIEDSRGEIKVAELAAVVDLSTRQLERRFRKAAGLTPKQFIRAADTRRRR